MLKMLFYILMFFPIVFPIVYGIKAIKENTKLKLWQISVISLIFQLIMTVLNSYLVNLFIKQSDSHDGLPMIGVVASNLILGGIILGVIIIQIIVYFSVKEKTIH